MRTAEMTMIRHPGDGGTHLYTKSVRFQGAATVDWFSVFIVSYGGAATFLFSFLENVGLPFPAFPLFLLAGALAAAGYVSLPMLILGAVLGAVVADGIWYELGRRRGKTVLYMLCRISLNPDVCVESAVDQFHRRKTVTILLAKFLPGVNSVMPPLAGFAAVPLALFLFIDFLGALLWAAAGTGLGQVFGLEIAGSASTVQGGMLWILVAGLIAYILWAIGYRFYLVKRYAAPRIDAGTLNERIKGEDAPIVLDLRRDEYYDKTDRMIDGSFRLR
ncbi:MAG TPA: DedA family protein, partial [Candidatus Bathyarchaeia archaeon]|nr:DedA family protein [Candidatus Bathyarchaeia archaeon]